ncbi:MAG: heparan-alpha-glucosaminide N-acetyltransferase domain-containing protein [Promethearchaeota archaeon]
MSSIDIFRGLGMVYIMVGHMIDWWTIPKDDFLFYIYVSLFSAIGAAGFVFISGVSTAVSYRNRLAKAKTSDDYNNKTIKKEYLFRAFLILIVALIYNSIVAIEFLDPLLIWKWFIILTVAICLLMALPLLKTSRLFRLFIGVIIWIVNQFILAFLLHFEAQANLFGLIFYILYNSLDQNPILSFFTFFLIGTVIGDLIYDIYQINDKIARKRAIKQKVLFPSLLIGITMIMFSFWFLLPNLFTEKILTINTNLWWLIYSLGIELILISILLCIEEFEFIKTEKSYKFLYYFSYYSLSLFLLQNINFFLFYAQLNRYNIWLFIGITVVIYDLLLRFLYKKLDSKFSLKVQVGRLAVFFTGKIEVKSEKN